MPLLGGRAMRENMIEASRSTDSIPSHEKSAFEEN